MFRNFISKLKNGTVRKHRDVAYYASKLCITPKYLSQICLKVSGRNASDWINRFALNELTTLMKDKKLTFAAIADQMDFSSPSYLSRFVRNNTGLSPTEYREKYKLFPMFLFILATTLTKVLVETVLQHSL